MAQGSAAQRLIQQGSRMLSNALPAQRVQSFCNGGLPASATVHLEYDVINGDAAGNNADGTVSAPPCIFLHGLLGSRRSLRTLGNLLRPHASKLIFVDQRNHGVSPRADTVGLKDMAGDILALMDREHIPKASLVGHSMGGRVAMALSVLAPSRVHSLAVLDIAPVYSKEDVTSPDALARSSIYSLLTLLDKMPLDEIKTKKEAPQWLLDTFREHWVKPLNETLLAFFLQNLTTDDNGIRWLPNIPVLHDRFQQDILLWPFENVTGEIPPAVEPHEARITAEYTQGPVVFVRGTKSPWVQDSHLEGIRRHFPNAIMSSVDSDHWLHHDMPNEVALKILQGWAKENTPVHEPSV